MLRHPFKLFMKFFGIGIIGIVFLWDERYRLKLLDSVVDPEPYWIRIQELPGSGSVIRIRIHKCKYRIK